MKPPRLPLSLSLCAALLACTDGYPSRDAVSVGAMRPDEHVRMLDTYLDDTPQGAALRLSLDDACHLSIHDTTQRGAPRERFGLAGLDFAFSTDADSGRWRVTASHAQQAQAPRTFEVANWVNAVAFRSHLQQLQRRCAEAGAASTTRPS